MKCNAYRILIRELEANALDPDETGLVEEHLRACEGCLAFQEGLRANADGRREDVEVPGGALRGVGQPGRSWGWAAAAVIALAVTIGVLPAAGGRGWLHRSGGHGAGCARTAVWGHR
ncbi:MAG: zf-HC2 domain-containing protein [Victivallales bacterium]|jgi:hypothetical protein|nr:zf-HC2 domain-containing protein [Victivallales bacterium]